MAKMLFTERHIPKIRSGEKIATRRKWSDNYNRPNEGAIHMASTSLFTPTDECDCFIEINDVYQQPLGAMEQADFEKEGGYSRKEFIDVWEDLYGEWDPEAVVDVVEFAYVGTEPPETVVV
jgi:hypothetical protein